LQNTSSALPIRTGTRWPRAQAHRVWGFSFVPEEDRPVTLLPVGGNDSTLRLHVALATTTYRDVEDPNGLGNHWSGFGLIFEE